MAYYGEKRRQYQNELYKKRRTQYILENGPCANCGSNENLQIDHIVARINTNKQTVKSSAIWGLSEKKRKKELKKCQILCRSCHQKKTYVDLDCGQHGVSLYKKGCRCNVCRTEAVKKVNEWRWKTGRRKKRNSQIAQSVVQIAVND